MSLTVADAVFSLEQSRRFFLKHLDGITEDLWNWKPYPECKSITETITHLIVDDRAALHAVNSAGHPDYDGISASTTEEVGGDRNKALALVAQSHADLTNLLSTQFADADPASEISIWGDARKLIPGICHLCSEDFYHAGQVAFIRMATNPQWDYYSQIYGM